MRTSYSISWGFRGWRTAIAGLVPTFLEPMTARGLAMAGRPLADRSGQRHQPVLLREILDFFQPGPDQLYLDGNLGFGGHTEAILRAGASVVGIDLDSEAIDATRERLRFAGDHFQAIQGNAGDFPDLLISANRPAFEGILLDLGVSSWQLDEGSRGFSFQMEGPLDMRMNQEARLTASEIVNQWPEDEIARVLWELGEERGSRRIAAEIIRRRAARALETTTELAKLIESVLPRSGRLHPATRSFQALRIAVNAELDSLRKTLAHTVTWLKPGGKLAVISFHSLEDRIVKNFLREHSREWIDQENWPAPRPNPCLNFTLPRPDSVIPTTQEIARNPRARSARLRFAIRR